MEKTICSNNLDALENLCGEFRRHAFLLELIINAAYENRNGIGPLGDYLELMSELSDRLRQSSVDFGVLFDCIAREIDIDRPETVQELPDLLEGVIKL